MSDRRTEIDTATVDSPTVAESRVCAHGRLLRVCIVMGTHWAVRIGGSQYQAKCLIDALAVRGGFRIYYLARRVPSAGQSNHEVVRFGARGRLRKIPMFADLPSLYWKLTRLRPDIVYQRGLKAYTGICAYYSRGGRARFVFHIAHDDDVLPARERGRSPRAILRRLERRIAESGLRRADVIVAQTQDQARLLETNYGIRATAVVPNFHPIPARPAPAAPRAVVRVIWVANFKPAKRPELFVDLAAALAHRTDVQFTMIGRSGDERRYGPLVERISSLSNLTYLGELPVDRVEEEIARSDILVSTSSAEGFPNTFIQAWLRCVPVVSCFIDPDECLTEGGGGLLGGDFRGLCAAVESLLDDREQLDRFKRSAYALGLRRHGPEQSDRLIRLLVEREAVDT